jgi:hypothetical protein
MNDTFTDHRTPEELAASYPRMTMWTETETDTARAALQQAYDQLGRDRHWNVSALRLHIIKPALLTLGGKV